MMTRPEEISRFTWKDVRLPHQWEKEYSTHSVLLNNFAPFVSKNGDFYLSESKIAFSWDGCS